MLEMIFSLQTLEAAFRIATPLLLAALGGALTHKAGIFNIGLEGMMLASAFASVAVSYSTSSWVLGVLAGAATGLLAGLVFGAFTIDFRTDSIIVGTALNLLSLGATTYLLRAMFDVRAGLQSERIESIPDLHLPILEKLGFLNVFNNQSLFTYLSWILIAVLWFVVYHSPFGLHLRAAGENPEVLGAAGIRLRRVRYLAAIGCGALCGLAGTHLALGYLHQFVINITGGQGFIALAAVQFGQGNPAAIFAGTLLFGVADSVSTSLQVGGVPGYFSLMIPYVATIVALTVVAIRNKRKTKAAIVLKAGD